MNKPQKTYSAFQLISVATVANTLAQSRSIAGLGALQQLAEAVERGSLCADLYPPHAPCFNGGNPDLIGKPASISPGIWSNLAKKSVERYKGDVDDFSYRKDGSLLTKPTTQAEIRAYWDDLAERYIINLPGFDKLIRHSDKIKFEAGKMAFEIVLKAWVDGFTKLVKGDHEQRVAKLVDLIEKRMAQASPKRQLTRPQIAELVRKGLDNLRVIEPSVKVVFKNITVESTRDREFLDALRSSLPEAERDEDWFHEFSAAPMVQFSAGR